MRYAIIFACALGLAAGCVRVHTYEIDLSQVEGPQLDGKLRLTKKSWHRTGPFLITEHASQFERVELVASDGQTITVDTGGYQGVPVATVHPEEASRCSCWAPGSSGMFGFRSML